MTIKRYHSDAFSKFQRGALDQDGDLQTEILNHAKSMSGVDFVLWMEDKIRVLSPDLSDIFEGEEDLPIPDNLENFSEQEFKQLSRKKASALWGAWQGVSPGVLSSSAVWGYTTSRFMKAGGIAPHWLMVHSRSKSTGATEIDKALKEKDEEERKIAIDACVRSFLRRLSGIHERGTRSLYKDCAIAAAWWQHYIAEDVASVTGKGKDDILELLRDPGLWGKLTEKMASQLTVIGDRKIRAGILLFLLENPNAKGHLGNLIREIGIMSGWRALGMFEPADIRDIIADEVYPSITEESKQ